MNNITFDVCASIKTDKTFEELTVTELIGAVLKRLAMIKEEHDLEAFGLVDEYEDEA